MIRIVFILLLTCFIASVAVASETDWTVYLRATDGDFQNGAGTIALGTRATPPDVSIYDPNSGSQAQVAVYTPTELPPLADEYYQSPLSPGQVRTWDLRLWAGINYTGQVIRLSLWGSGNPSYTVPSVIGGGNAWYELEVIADPTGYYASGTTMNLTPPMSGTSTSPYTYLDFGVLKLTDTAAINDGIKLRFTAGVDPVPEPGSLLALGSGLIGLAVFRIRRKC